MSTVLDTFSLEPTISIEPAAGLKNHRSTVKVTSTFRIVFIIEYINRATVTFILHT